MQTPEHNEDEQEQIFYKPKVLSLVANLTNVYAWFNLIVAILYPVFRIWSLDNQIMNISSYPTMNGHWWEWENFTSDIVMEIFSPIVINTLSLIGWFFLSKGVSIGLNVLLEIDFNMKSKVEEAENE
jgi:hypothetical protein